MSLHEYTRRMNHVLDHIDRHLDQPLDLATLAEVAHFSPYHFHRVFAAWMGETLGEYLRRRRLEVAAFKLDAMLERNVLEIALGVGFGSGEAFARAFKLQFGCTPTAWRQGRHARWAATVAQARACRHDDRKRDQQDSNPDQMPRKPDQAVVRMGGDDGGPIPLIEEMKMNVRIEDFPPAKVAYMRRIGPYGPRIGDFWRQEFMPWVAASGLDARTLYGVGHDDPAVTPTDKCRYDACVEVDNDFVASGRVNTMTLVGGRYAVADFYGTPDNVAAAWTALFKQWLPNSGMQCDARPCFEIMRPDMRADAQTGAFGCQLCLPVRPL